MCHHERQAPFFRRSTNICSDFVLVKKVCQNMPKVGESICTAAHVSVRPVVKEQEVALSTAPSWTPLPRTALWTPLSNQSTLKAISRPCAASKAGNLRSFDWFAAGKLRTQQPPVCR